MSKKSKVPTDIKVDLPSSEPPKPSRSIEEIQQDFNVQCARAGHLQYQMYVHEKDLSILNEQLRSLNLEAAAAQAKKQSEEVTNE